MDKDLANKLHAKAQQILGDVGDAPNMLISEFVQIIHADINKKMAVEKQKLEVANSKIGLSMQPGYCDGLTDLVIAVSNSMNEI